MSKPTNIYELLGEDQGEEEKQTPNKKAQATQAKQPAPTTTGKGIIFLIFFFHSLFLILSIIRCCNKKNCSCSCSSSLSNPKRKYCSKR